MKKVNQLLYEALETLFNNHVNNGGKIKYPEKSYEHISNTLDLISIKYFGDKPETCNQQCLWDEGGPQLTDVEAYDELITRFKNAIL